MRRELSFSSALGLPASLRLLVQLVQNFLRENPESGFRHSPLPAFMLALIDEMQALM
jgi:hypothetical protein